MLCSALQRNQLAGGGAGPPAPLRSRLLARYDGPLFPSEHLLLLFSFLTVMRPEIYQGHNGYQAAVMRVVTRSFILVPCFIYEGDIMFYTHFTDVE